MSGITSLCGRSRVDGAAVGPLLYADVGLSFWGGVDPARFAEAASAGRLEQDIPTNHSPFYAPEIHPTIEVGVTAMSAAAREFLG